MTSKKISIVVPVYNEEDAIAEFVRNLRQAMDGTCEGIIVDDCSDDTTSAILDALAGKDAIRIVRHEDRRGYGAAIKTGVAHAAGEYLCIIDGDNTYSPGDIRALARHIGECDMVVGSRKKSAHLFPFRQKIAKGFICLALTLAFKQRIPDVNSGLRIMKKSVLRDYLPALCNGFSFTASITLTMLLDRRTVRFVPISYAKRRGKSKVRVSSYVISFIKSYCTIIGRHIRSRRR
jgi:glycosyltransferase involved in cell wall biosynthesis